MRLEPHVPSSMGEQHNEIGGLKHALRTAHAFKHGGAAAAAAAIAVDLIVID